MRQTQWMPRRGAWSKPGTLLIGGDEFLRRISVDRLCEILPLEDGLHLDHRVLHDGIEPPSDDVPRALFLTLELRAHKRRIAKKHPRTLPAATKGAALEASLELTGNCGYDFRPKGDRKTKMGEDVAKEIRGLATVAILKANFDKGKDHLEMFLPFLVDSMARIPRDDFTTHELQERLREAHGLSVPQGALKTLLTRAKKRGFVRREGGKYLRNPKVLSADPLEPQIELVNRNNRSLGAAFRRYAVSKNLVLNTDDEALALLVAFLAEHEMAILSYDGTIVETPVRHKIQRVVAHFFQKTLSSNSELTEFLEQLIQGYVLQNALLLKDISEARKPFRKLEVFLDSRCVLRALGLEGDPSKIATREAITILKTTHARLAVFQSTIDEIRRILTLFEHRIGTTSGRESLRQNALARHLLSNQYSPSEVRQAKALIENNLKQLGITAREFPKRVPAFTLTERSLTLRLKRPSESETEPRIVHDVDCMAAILTLRAGLQPTSYDDAVAVFLTTNKRLVDTVSEWMKEEKVNGLPPIVSQIRLTNFAWLKKPAGRGWLEDGRTYSSLFCCSSAKPGDVGPFSAEPTAAGVN